ncbi:50S ribosomal protein L3 N(5)-glutamine methyltransferase [Aquabacterium lacunae]|uniref:50S ribosomal protein L3 N(5)-glutamine methyltransferase n=1 Tax=Aquabacterium lacunae TaxID=2528630 RepID=A0A4Q9GWE6_9BURK|nr:50S ribosomal protein L3 N(5)-glutamine methyltransferase [Aquabacterium lacunae]TBO28750.1 50S ribosomal protein L3 N(5)-glutamine methyltransferase [Aquabacterium lacunae]
MSALTVIALIEQAAEQLEAAQVAYGHGTATAFDEAAWLVLWRLGLPIDQLDEVEQQPVPPEAAAQVQALIDERIRTRKPAAYLTQEAWLQGVPFYVDERAIVPRSFIAEVLADGSIDPWLHPQSTRVLDLCTGNGSLAVLAAMAYPDVQVDGADLSTDALAVARINVDKHALQSRITLLQSDGLGSVQGPYDLILCNPPYVNATSMAALPAEYQAEPAMALGSGADGMDFCRAFIGALRADPDRYLTEEGVVVLEIGNEREHFEAAFPDLPVFWLATSSGDDQLLLFTREALDTPIG